ncbi:hypothetical protein M404DRAFT_647358 [Pisolithus tinctorius Marx 270]|uniref:Uncharacterized protein n=1 Tax=Pisolithus tinctorius Marx 270 TaxID=870435 RepID=A0A0C3P5R8_PISTI|nr:hypothetical protein M404DRAFT_647358 [Pisolithus tinctorius Marx 270]
MSFHLGSFDALVSETNLNLKVVSENLQVVEWWSLPPVASGIARCTCCAGRAAGATDVLVTEYNLPSQTINTDFYPKY